jgi:hypothetical protein
MNFWDICGTVAEGLDAASDTAEEARDALAERVGMGLNVAAKGIRARRAATAVKKMVAAAEQGEPPTKVDLVLTAWNHLFQDDAEDDAEDE